MLYYFRRSVLLLLLCLSLVSCQRGDKSPSPVAAPPQGDWSSPVAAVTTFYKAVAEEKFDVAWWSLSQASQEKFIEGLVDEAKISPFDARRYFEQNDPALRRGFWKSFRESSKIPTMMSEAKFQLLSAAENRAQVQVISGSTTLENVAVKEGSQWRMGFVETFMK